MKLLEEINCIENAGWKMFMLDIYAEHEEKFRALEEYIKSEEERFCGELQLYPPSNIFNAFNYFNPTDTKVVILGQDCYHGKGQAMGLSFSVPLIHQFHPPCETFLKN